MPKRGDPPFHRLSYQENSLTLPVELGALNMGDIFVRDGAPCMVIGPSSLQVDKNPFVVPNRVWITNLTNGHAWPAAANDQVYPAFNVKLSFDTTRRDG